MSHDMELSYLFILIVIHSARGVNVFRSSMTVLEQERRKGFRGELTLTLRVGS